MNSNYFIIFAVVIACSLMLSDATDEANYKRPASRRRLRREGRRNGRKNGGSNGRGNRDIDYGDGGDEEGGSERAGDQRWMGIPGTNPWKPPKYCPSGCIVW
eukprot:g7868.t1 g7868   contig26:447997-448391(+)